jgi:hypothetical protein
MKGITSDPEVLRDVKRLYIEGLKRGAICKATGLTDGAVQFIIYHKLQLHLRYPRKKKSVPIQPELPKEKINRIISLAYWGYHVAEIAEDQGIHHNQVHGIIEDAKRKGVLKM